MTDSSDRDRVLRALNAVIDPATGRGLADAGMVRGLVAENGRAGFVIEAPAEKVAVYAAVRQEAEAVLKALSGIERVHVVLTAEQTPARARGASLSRAALDQGRAKAPVATERPEHVRRVIAVASGKGGVGKSTVAVNLAVALAAGGLKTGLLDADVYGPSAPLMLGLHGAPSHDGERLVPLAAHGVKAMSTGLLVGAEQAMVWRGPMASQALTQMLTQTRWGSAEEPLDILVVDLPPGTGDVQLTLVQKTLIDGVVVVSTPQEAALADARRAVAMFGKTGTPVIGLVENMSGAVFGEGGGAREAARLGVRFLGSIPLEAMVREGGDSGRPVVLGNPGSDSASAFTALAALVSA